MCTSSCNYHVSTVTGKAGRNRSSTRDHKSRNDNFFCIQTRVQPLGHEFPSIYVVILIPTVLRAGGSLRYIHGRNENGKQKGKLFSLLHYLQLVNASCFLVITRKQKIDQGMCVFISPT